MPFTSKTILLAGAIGALAMLGAVEAQAGHMHMPYAPVGAYPLDPTAPPLLTPLTDEALDAAEDAHDAVADAAEDAAAAAVSAAALAHDMLDD
jgi:hypothetical protein